MLRAIGRRQHNEYATQASFHGIKIPMQFSKEVEETTIDDTFDVEAIEHAIRNSQMRVKARYVRPHH